MAILFLHGLKNSLGFQSRYQSDTTFLDTLNISWLPKQELISPWLESKKGTINAWIQEGNQFLLLKHTLDPFQFCSSNGLITNIFIPFAAPLASFGLSYLEKSGNKPAKEIKEGLKLFCIVIHITVAIYFFPTEKKSLAFGLIAGHIIGALKPKEKSPRYEFFLFILQGGASLSLGSIYDKVFNIAFLLLNYPNEFAKGMNWVKTKIFKPQ